MGLFRRKKQVVEAPEPEPEPTLPPAPDPDELGRRSVADHRDWLLSMVEPLPPFGMELLDAWGLPVCEDLLSDIALPAHDQAAIAGYAVRAADVAGAAEDNPLKLTAIGSLDASDGAEGFGEELPARSAVRVTVGAPIPGDADAVVPLGLTDRGEQELSVFGHVRAGDNIRARGSDVSIGDELIRDGDLLGARNTGLLAATGFDKVLARPRPRVVVLATGTDLVPPGTGLREGEVYDSNSHMLAAAARAQGAQVFRVGIVSDDPEEVKQTISDQLVRADLLICTGGRDDDQTIVGQVVPELGPTDVSEVALQPGHKQGFGLIGDEEVPIVLLPGDPVGAFVSFEVFVRPLLRKQMGLEPLDRSVLDCTLATQVTSEPGVAEVLRARITDTSEGPVIEPIGSPDSHQLGDLAEGNALLLLDPDTEVLEKGDLVLAWPLQKDDR